MGVLDSAEQRERQETDDRVAIASFIFFHPHLLWPCRDALAHC